MIKEGKQNKAAKTFIIIVSVAIPVVVALLYLVPQPENISPSTRNLINFLPTFNAIINGTTFFVLIAAFVAIRNQNIKLHRRLMTSALVFSALFLISYVIFHLTSEETKFGGEGTIRYIYFFILASHILLSVVIVPLVLISYTRALAERFDKHRKIARITLPIWLYVTLTGVMVYLMISPYYAFN